MTATTTPPVPTLTVAAVARRLGVAPPTLRTWDRRYGLGPSAHTAGAHRRYSPADVARLMVMRRLTLEGVSPADAAKIAVATPVTPDGRPMHTPADGLSFDDVVSESADRFRSGPDGGSEVGPDGEWVEPSQAHDAPPPDAVLEADDAVPESDVVAETGAVPEVDGTRPTGEATDEIEDAAGSVPRPEVPGPETDLDEGLDASGRQEPSGSDEPGQETRFDSLPEIDTWLGVLRSVGSGRGTPGGGRVVAMPAGTPQNRGLARAAMSLDTYETHRLLTDSIRRQGVVPTWNAMIMPVLRALGERTRVTGDGIDVEHAFSEVILGVMRSVALGLQQPHSSVAVLLACADSEYHSLPLHALAAALAERQIPARMLGAGLPPAALAASVRRTGSSVIVLFARMPGADATASEALRRQQRPAPTVILAGPGWLPETVPSTARTASSLDEAVDEVLRAVQA